MYYVYMRYIILITTLLFSLNILSANPPEHPPKKPNIENKEKENKDTKGKKGKKPHKRPHKPMPKKVLPPN